MIKKLITIITYTLIFFNSNLYSDENNKILKVGLLAPLTGEYKDLGNSLLYSLQLALNEIGDKNVYVVPADTGSNDKLKLVKAVEELYSKNIKIIIGPINNNDFNEVKKFNDIVFISPSNKTPEFENNIISIGVSFESQMLALVNFIKKQKKIKL